MGGRDKTLMESSFAKAKATVCPSPTPVPRYQYSPGASREPPAADDNREPVRACATSSRSSSGGAAATPPLPPPPAPPAPAASAATSAAAAVACPCSPLALARTAATYSGLYFYSATNRWSIVWVRRRHSSRSASGCMDAVSPSFASPHSTAIKRNSAFGVSPRHACSPRISAKRRSISLTR